MIAPTPPNFAKSKVKIFLSLVTSRSRVLVVVRISVGRFRGKGKGGKGGTHRDQSGNREGKKKKNLSLSDQMVSWVGRLSGLVLVVSEERGNRVEW